MFPTRDGMQLPLNISPRDWQALFAQSSGWGQMQTMQPGYSQPPPPQLMPIYLPAPSTHDTQPAQQAEQAHGESQGRRSSAGRATAPVVVPPHRVSSSHIAHDPRPEPHIVETWPMSPSAEVQPETTQHASSYLQHQPQQQQQQHSHGGPAMPSVGKWNGKVELAQRWLLFMRHCATCNGGCVHGERCRSGRGLWTHMINCQASSSSHSCQYPKCQVVKAILKHHRTCSSVRCLVCMPVKRYVNRKVKEPAAAAAAAVGTQQQQQQPANTAAPGVRFAANGPTGMHHAASGASGMHHAASGPPGMNHAASVASAMHRAASGPPSMHHMANGGGPSGMHAPSSHPDHAPSHAGPGHPMSQPPPGSMSINPQAWGIKAPLAARPIP